MKADAVDANGDVHKAREFDQGRGSEPDTMTCTCGKKLPQTPADPAFERHLREVETRDGGRALAEAQRKLAEARNRHDRGARQ